MCHKDAKHPTSAATRRTTPCHCDNRVEDPIEAISKALSPYSVETASSRLILPVEIASSLRSSQ
jgi:hypothetical protein